MHILSCRSYKPSTFKHLTVLQIFAATSGDELHAGWTHSWQSVSLNLNCVRSISVIQFETGILLVCGYTLGRRVSHTVSAVTVILTLSSDPSSRKIVSRAYILYCFKIGIPNLDCGYMLGCQSVPYWLGLL